MAFNDTLDFSPSVEKLERQTRPYHVLLSRYLQLSRTFELYEKIALMNMVESHLIPFELPADNQEIVDCTLSALLNLMRRDQNFRSILVSDPYKVKVQPYIDRVAESAKSCGATNVVFNEQGLIVGENFDGLAFKRGAVEVEGVTFTGKAMVFLGCGGVSSAVSIKLAKDLNRICLCDPLESRSHELKRLLLAANRALDVQIINPSDIADFSSFDYVYNGTGLGKHDSKSPIRADQVFNSFGIAFDANYTPMKTAFLQQMHERGYRTINGLSHMLMCTTAHLARVTQGSNSSSREGSAVTFAVVKAAYDSIWF